MYVARSKTVIDGKTSLRMTVYRRGCTKSGKKFGIPKYQTPFRTSGNVVWELRSSGKVHRNFHRIVRNDREKVRNSELFSPLNTRFSSSLAQVNLRAYG